MKLEHEFGGTEIPVQDSRLQETIDKLNYQLQEEIRKRQNSQLEDSDLLRIKEDLHKVQMEQAVQKWEHEREELKKGLEQMLESKLSEFRGWQTQLEDKGIELS